MTVRSVPFCLSVLLFLLTALNVIDAYSRLGSIDNGDEFERELKDLWPVGQLAEGDLIPRREQILQKMQEILGIRSQSENLAHRKIPPQFMMELYHTIVDSSGVTRGRNPYNARIVRSFVERGNTFNISHSQLYFFNISGLEINESVLEAELHLHRKKTSLRNVRPSIITSPYYLIKVYQVLDNRSLDAPDLHRLLNVRYVGAHAFGWQVFNVKEAILGWMSGEPNLGLLVTASNQFEDEVSVEFSRRNNNHHSKQPILVLFDDDGDDRSSTADIAPRYYAYENQDDEESQEDELAYEKDAKSEKIDLEDDYGRAEHYYRHKRQQDGGQSEEVLLIDRHQPEFFQRQKKRREEDGESAGHDDSQGKRRPRDAASSRENRTGRIVSEDREKLPRVLTSMDIYKRAMLREKLDQTARDRSTRRSIARQRRSASNQNATAKQKDATQKCTLHELYVSFADIGLSHSIIAPYGYSAYQCKGVCEPPLSQDQRPTNHATIQAIVHKIGLVEGVERPCCVPTKLLNTSILFYDGENVVLKMYTDMIANRCGCR